MQINAIQQYQCGSLSVSQCIHHANYSYPELHLENLTYTHLQIVLNRTHKEMSYRIFFQPVPYSWSYSVEYLVKCSGVVRSALDFLYSFITKIQAARVSPRLLGTLTLVLLAMCIIYKLFYGISIFHRILEFPNRMTFSLFDSWKVTIFEQKPSLQCLKSCNLALGHQWYPPRTKFCRLTFCFGLMLITGLDNSRIFFPEFSDFGILHVHAVKVVHIASHEFKSWKILKTIPKLFRPKVNCCRFLFWLGHLIVPVRKWGLVWSEPVVRTVTI